ncbi:MAG TPA: sialidase family protein, partial [Flavisolibacter sp.]|nr:sialidase family protein [Flavisolibacter sp.]
MKTILFLAVAVSLTACLQQPKLPDAVTQGTTVDSQPGECPYLTKDNKGNAVLSWVRMINDSTTAFCYATSTDGKAFAAPAIVPNSSRIQPHGENLPKIIFKPSGEIIALWGAGNPNPRNKYSGLVFYTQSFDKGNTWTKPTSLVKDTASFDQRYYDVALLPNGEVGIIWLDNRKTTQKAGSGLYFASTNGSNGFG